ncbi:TetR/AcrR family transcriptional regulator, partial [Rhizobium phaseoli]
MSKTSRRLIFALMNDRMTPGVRMTGHSQRGQCAKRISILDAAADVFCRQGFAAASID